MTFIETGILFACIILVGGIVAGRILFPNKVRIAMSEEEAIGEPGPFYGRGEHPHGSDQ